MAPNPTAQIRTRSGVLVADLSPDDLGVNDINGPAVTQLAWTDAFNAVGSGTVSIPNDDPRAGLLTPGYDIWFNYHGQNVWRMPIRLPPNRSPIKGQEEAGQFATVAGPGVGIELEGASLLPYKGEANKLPITAQHRIYSFASPDFPNLTGWIPAIQGLLVSEINPVRYDLIEYHTIIAGVNPGDPEFEDTVVDIVPAPAPLDWVVDSAYWIWGTEDTNPLGKVYFRKTWNVAAAGTYIIDVTADNFYTLFLDGQPLLGEIINTFGWKEFRRHRIQLEPGEYTVAAVVENTGGIAGFACGGWVPDGNEDLFSVEFVSDSSWICLPYPETTPGWTPSQVLLDMLEEVQGRGLLANWEFDFKAANDSLGNALPYMEYFSVPIGAKVSDAIVSLQEQGWINWRVLPNRMLQIYAYDAAPIDSGIAFTADGDTGLQLVTDLDVTAVDPPVSHIHAKWGDGNLLRNNPTTAATYGAFEVFMSIDGGTLYEVERQIELELEKHSVPVINYHGTAKPLDLDSGPYFGFNPGDYVDVEPGDGGAPLQRRVMSFTVNLTDDPEPDIEFDLEERRPSFIQRTEHVLQALGTGIVSERVVRRTTGLSVGRGGQGGGAYGPALRPFSDAPPIRAQRKVYIPQTIAEGGGLSVGPSWSMAGLLNFDWYGQDYYWPDTQTFNRVYVSQRNPGGAETGDFIIEILVNDVVVDTVSVTAVAQHTETVAITVPAGQALTIQVVEDNTGNGLGQNVLVVMGNA